MADPTASEDAPAGKRPLHRNPFFWGAIAGLVLVPAVRPFMRRVPDPPAVLAQMPRFELHDHRGSAFGSDALLDHVYLASVLDGVCEGACAKRAAALVGLHQRCRRMGVKLWMVTLSLAPERDTAESLRAVLLRHGADLAADANPWIVLHGQQARSLGTGPFARLLDPVEKPGKPGAPAAMRSVLVDGDGGIRGAWPTDDDGLYEVFHRAQHVMSLRRAWR